MLALYFSVWQSHEDQTVEELLDTPIASALWKDDVDGLQSLQKFIAVSSIHSGRRLIYALTEAKISYSKP